ncbi:MAG: serine protease [Burkholderiales bacterium]
MIARVLTDTATTAEHLSVSTIRSLDRAGVARAADELARAGSLNNLAPTIDQLIAVAEKLRAERLFNPIIDLASSGVWQRVKSPWLTRVLGQALVEEGRFSEATTHLRSILTTDQALQAQGLLGRIEKQIFVNEASVQGTGDPARLGRAIDIYLAAYEGDKARPSWHGINAAALLARARRDGMTHPRLDDVAKIARGIIRKIGTGFDPGAVDGWNLATLGEAHLVLNDLDQAELWLRRFAAADNLELFALASTTRQLEEVWGLRDDRAPGNRILPVLKRALAREGRLALIAPRSVHEATPASLEKVFGNAGFMTPEKLRLGLTRCEAVGRVEELTGEGFGTGFVLPGNALKKSWGSALVFVTNAHVLSESDPDAVSPKKAQVTFHAVRDSKGRPHTTRLGEILASSPPDKLDHTIVRIKTAPRGVASIPLAEKLPSADSKERLYAIGHPKGGALSFSMQDNEMLDHGAPKNARVHYRTPTEPGSSGSPIFNASWDLVALHHSGSAAMKKIHGEGTYEANEGIWIQKIRADL